MPRSSLSPPRRSSSLPPRAQWRDVYPIVPYFGYAERIVTAAGFNIMADTEALHGAPPVRPVSALTRRLVRARRERN
ncbi:MAG: hypothetical protein ACXVV5_21740 [Solirubrobacteraceae bacterium]